MKIYLKLESKIASGLTELRKSRNITQVELAKMLGTKQTVISRIESGAAVPSWDFIKRIAEALEAEVDILFKPISAKEKFLPGQPHNGNEFVCVNCMYQWESKLNRHVIQCPQCHKRQGILLSEYSKALQAYKDIQRQVKESPPFKKLPPVNIVKQNTPKMLKLLFDTAGSTFPSPKLPFSLLFRIIEQSKREKDELPEKQIISSNGA